MNVMELFAGVGGFRLGLERADKEYFKTVYMNQWEPGVKTQSAFNCYKENFKSGVDRKSTRLNSSHVSISYAVFCLKKKKKKYKRQKKIRNDSNESVNRDR